MIRAAIFILAFSIESGIGSLPEASFGGKVVSSRQHAAFNFLSIESLTANRHRLVSPDVRLLPLRHVVHTADICVGPSRSWTSRVCLSAKRRRRSRGNRSSFPQSQDSEVFQWGNSTQKMQLSSTKAAHPPSVPLECTADCNLTLRDLENESPVRTSPSDLFKMSDSPAQLQTSQDGNDVVQTASTSQSNITEKINKFRVASPSTSQSNITEKINKFREASRARQEAILSARKARWDELSRRMNSTDASSASDADDLKYYESVPEAVLVRFAKWTKSVPAVDALFRPIDALLDVIENSLKDQPSQGSAEDSQSDLRSKFKRYRNNLPKSAVNVTPQPVKQGKRYPVSLTSGSLRTKDGTVYSMPADRSGSIKKERKEIRLRELVRAWYGHSRYLWETVLEDEDGMWLTVGADVREEVTACISQGVLSLPIPFSECLGDPCPDVEKVLCMDIVDGSGLNRSVIWSDSQEKVKFFRAIQTTHSIKRLANIVTGDSSIKDAIEETIPMVASLRSNLFRANETGKLAEGHTTYELEARLGRWLPGTFGTPGRFRNGVTREFMDRVLGMCEGWDDWKEDGEWKEIHDYILKVGSNQYRLAVAFNQNTQQATKVVLQKKILKIKDFSYISTIGDGQPLTALSSDVRIALSEERILTSDASIIRNGTQIRVRIKQRKSFLYTPSNAAKPVWRFDFTLVWSGKNLGHARSQQMNTEPDFELECECIDPYEYLTNQTDDRVVAEGLLLKLRDFLGPWGGYRLEMCSKK